MDKFTGAAGFEASAPGTLGELLDTYDDNERRTLKDLGITKASDFMANEPPPMQWLVENLVPANSFVVLGGAPKTCKSWMALDIGISVALREPAFNSNFNVYKPQAVLFIMLEDAASNIYGRVRAIGQSKMATIEDLKRAPMYFRFHRSLDLGDPVAIEWMAHRIKDSIPEIGLIIIDPMRNAHNLDENDSTNIKLLTDNIRALRDITGASVLITHHLRKMSKADKVNPGFALRGSGAIYGAVDGLITLADEPKSNASEWISHVKVRIKAGREPDPFMLTLNVEDGHDNRANFVKWTTTGYCNAEE